MNKLFFIMVIGCLAGCGAEGEPSGRTSPSSSGDVNEVALDVNSEGPEGDDTWALDVGPRQGDVGGAPSEVASAPVDATSGPLDTGGASSEVTVEHDMDSSTVTPPDEVDPQTLGGGLLIFELASEFLNQAGAGARFTDPVQASEEGQELYGSCVVTHNDPDAPPAPPAVGHDAGLITVSGTTPAVVLTPVDEGAHGTGYATGLSDTLETVLPAGGALLNVSAEGGVDIPAFGMYVQVPEPVNITSPSMGLFSSISISSALDVIWDQGTGDVVLVTVTPLSSSTFQAIAGKGLICTQQGDLGVLSIPADALQVVKSSGVSKVAIGVTRMRTSSANAGPWVVPAAVSRSSGGPVSLD
jgi:hypothetical protein